MWIDILRRTAVRLSRGGWLANFVIGLSFLLVAPVMNSVVQSPKGTIISLAIGLTILIWVVAGAMIRSIPAGPQTQRTVVPADVPVPEADSRNPGLSLHMFISVHNLPVERRKYLFDFGRVNRERLSVYVSAGNVFTVALVDADREPHLLQVPLGRGGVPTSEPVYLACEAGVSSDSTSLSLFVNGRPLRTVTFPFRVNLGAVDVPGGVIAGDLDGKDGASFDLYELAAYGATVTSEQLAQLAKYFTRPRTAWVAFRGTQWMRVAEFKKP